MGKKLSLNLKSLKKKREIVENNVKKDNPVVETRVRYFLSYMVVTELNSGTIYGNRVFTLKRPIKCKKDIEYIESELKKDYTMKSVVTIINLVRLEDN